MISTNVLDAETDSARSLFVRLAIQSEVMKATESDLSSGPFIKVNTARWIAHVLPLPVRMLN